MSDPVKEFARWVIQNSAWQGCDLDGEDVEAKATKLGLLRQTTFDPARHGRDMMDEFQVDAGDTWFEFTELLK